jgi:hypothetical protein
VSKYQWEVVKKALLNYKLIYGHMKVQQCYVIPEDTNDWPTELWKIPLGMDTYTNMYICVCACIYIYIYVYTYTYIHICNIS